MKIDLVNDLEILTTIQRKALVKLVNKSNYIICNAVTEMLLADEDLCEINIGIGTIMIKKIGNEIKYKFVPSAKLNSSIVEIFTEGSNPLSDVLELALKDKIENTYKELF